MVAYIRSDLDFILAQIMVAEKHAAYVANPMDPNAAPLYGVGLAGQVGSVPTYTLSIGLRTVDGQYNNLLPGQEQWGSADQQFPELLDTVVSARGRTCRSNSDRRARPPCRRRTRHRTTRVRWCSIRACAPFPT